MVKSCVDLPFVSRFTSAGHELIRGPVASARSGHTGADREASQRAPRDKPASSARMRLDRHRGPGRRQTASDRRKALALGLEPSSGLPHSSPRTVVQITPWKGGAGFQADWRRIRTFDNQIRSLMLYPTELSVVQMKGLEPPTSDPMDRRSTTELHPRFRPPKRRRTQGGSATCAGGDQSSNRCARFGVRDRERASTPCDGLSQAALWWRKRGFFRKWLSGNTFVS